MTGRLIWAIISTVLEEAAIVVVVLWGLPQIGIRIPLPGMIVLMVAWLVFSILVYRVGTRALLRKPVTGLSDMTGSRGKVVAPLAPEGVVRIRGELWEARVSGEEITSGEIEVVGQEGLKLIVRKLERKKD